jgi:hypothetical protein
MPDRTPIKYEDARHAPFAPGDTVPASSLALAQRLRAGHGIEISADADGGITITNTCCPDHEAN